MKIFALFVLFGVISFGFTDDSCSVTCPNGSCCPLYTKCNEDSTECAYICGQGNLQNYSVECGDGCCPNGYTCIEKNVCRSQSIVEEIIIPQYKYSLEKKEMENLFYYY